MKSLSIIKYTVFIEFERASFELYGKGGRFDIEKESERNHLPLS